MRRVAATALIALAALGTPITNDAESGGCERPCRTLEAYACFGHVLAMFRANPRV